MDFIKLKDDAPIEIKKVYDEWLKNNEKYEPDEFQKMLVELDK